MIEQTTCPKCLIKLCEMSLYDDLDGKLSCPECKIRVDRWVDTREVENIVKFDYEDFTLMLNAAWNAFENTLFVWGVTQEQTDKFAQILDCKDGYKAVDDALAESVDWKEE